MAFMKRDVNFGLLLLIIASILVFSGFTVYYQTTFKDVSLEYKTKLEQLQKVTSDLSVQKQQLNETYALRVKAEQDRRVLDESYKELSDERNQLESDNAKLETDLISTKNDLATTQIELNNKKVQLVQAEIDRDRYKADSEKYESRWKTVCADYTPLNGGVEHDKC